jgi:hypothetical protein
MNLIFGCPQWNGKAKIYPKRLASSKQVSDCWSFAAEKSNRKREYHASPSFAIVLNLGALRQSKSCPAPSYGLDCCALLFSIPTVN